MRFSVPLTIPYYWPTNKSDVIFCVDLIEINVAALPQVDLSDVLAE
jgi:hypothetical protein